MPPPSQLMFGEGVPYFTFWGVPRGERTSHWGPSAEDRLGILRRRTGAGQRPHKGCPPPSVTHPPATHPVGCPPPPTRPALGPAHHPHQPGLHGGAGAARQGPGAAGRPPGPPRAPPHPRPLPKRGSGANTWRAHGYRSVLRGWHWKRFFLSSPTPVMAFADCFVGKGAAKWC